MTLTEAIERLKVVRRKYGEASVLLLDILVHGHADQIDIQWQWQYHGIDGQFNAPSLEAAIHAIEAAAIQSSSATPGDIRNTELLTLSLGEALHEEALTEYDRSTR